MKNCFKSIKMLISKYPFYLVEEILSCLCAIATSIIPIYTVSTIIDYYYDASKTIKDVMIYVFIVFGIIALLNIINFGLSLLKMNMQRLFVAKTSKEFYKKLQEIDYDYHESPMFLNDYTRALEEGVNFIYQVANNTFLTLQILAQSISVLTVFTIFIKNNPIILIIAFLMAIIYLIIYIRIGTLSKKMRKEHRQFHRTSWYSNRAFTIKDGMADIKTSDIDKLLIDNNERALGNCVKVIDKYNPKIATWGFFSEIVLASLYPLIIGVLAYINTDISTFASLTVAASTLSGLITRFASSIGSIEEVLPDCKVPFDLLKMKGLIETNDGERLENDFEEIEISNASFSYQGKKNQLEDINISIKKGEHIAIVGANGAGKTTLVKILLRLYDVNNGEIKINGKNYKDVNVKDLRKRVGAVFQNIETYAVSIAENVLLRKPTCKEDYDLIDEALKFSGLYDYVHNLKDGVNTEISREFYNQGEIFSGGQNQRLAIARGYAQNYQLFILDEPSSALDPIAEAQVYKNMLELGKDKTLVFISHRLTTTVNADKIYLFENGRIIEAGTHDELMALNGLYHKMFVSQSSKYIGDDYE